MSGWVDAGESGARACDAGPLLESGGGGARAGIAGAPHRQVSCGLINVKRFDRKKRECTHLYKSAARVRRCPSSCSGAAGRAQGGEGRGGEGFQPRSLPACQQHGHTTEHAAALPTGPARHLPSWSPKELPPNAPACVPQKPRALGPWLAAITWASPMSDTQARRSAVSSTLLQVGRNVVQTRQGSKGDRQAEGGSPSELTPCQAARPPHARTSARAALHSMHSKAGTACTAGPCLTQASGRRAAPARGREGSAAPLPRLSPPGGPCAADRGRALHASR